MRLHKYRRGDKIPSIYAALKEIEQGQYLWLRDRPCHPSVLVSMTLRTLKQLTYGSLFYAVNNWLPAIPEEGRHNGK